MLSFVEQRTRSCKKKLDIGIVLDGSGSIGQNAFDYMKSFVLKMVAFFGVSDSATRVGLVYFSDNAKLVFRLGQLIAYSQFRRELSNIRYEGGSSRLDLAMQVASTMFSSENGGRPGIPKVLFVVSDGIQSVSSRMSLIKESVKSLRDNGVLMITASAGQNVNFGVLRDIAGDRTRTFIASTHDKMESESFLKAISDSACKYARKHFEYLYIFLNTNSDQNWGHIDSQKGKNL